MKVCGQDGLSNRGWVIVGVVSIEALVGLSLESKGAEEYDVPPE